MEVRQTGGLLALAMRQGSGGRDLLKNSEPPGQEGTGGSLTEARQEGRSRAQFFCGSPCAMVDVSCLVGHAHRIHTVRWQRGKLDLGQREDYPGWSRASESSVKVLVVSVASCTAPDSRGELPLAARESLFSGSIDTALGPAV
ncbi:hypothetical protein IAQ61_008255 [Plenodomus lingam]|uniref:uncharacterized protein n=1 Tax=Leptosphaeria maculans TaxID=5022 RepID=UPI0033272DCB|nr:hypothetical protein IAQ61_008255 [Plenodomus lingam]